MEIQEVTVKRIHFDTVANVKEFEYQVPEKCTIDSVQVLIVKDDGTKVNYVHRMDIKNNLISVMSSTPYRFDVTILVSQPTIPDALNYVYLLLLVVIK